MITRAKRVWRWEWTEEMDKILRKEYPTTNTHDVAKHLGLPYDAVKSRASRMKIHKTKGFRGLTKRIPINDELLKSLYFTHNNRDISKILGIAQSTVQVNIIRLKLIGKPDHLKGRFKKGSVPPNKGVKGWDAGGRSHETRFPKGHLSANTLYDRAITLRHPHKKRHAPPYFFIRLAPMKWYPLHQFLWEEAHGKQPKGHLVNFIDGNSLNCVLENLQLITRKKNMLRNSGSVNLSDSYVASMIVKEGRNKVDKEMSNEILNNYPGLIVAKRAQLILNRKIKEHENTNRKTA